MPVLLPSRPLVESLIRQTLFTQIGRDPQSAAPPTLVVNSSARHMHVSPENLAILFGQGYALQPHKWLYQDGQFASQAVVTLVGPRERMIPQLRILGPCRNLTQIELAYTDAVYLGLTVPVRPSGNIAGTTGGVVIGPKGVVELKEGIIRAARHVHMSPADAAYYGVKHGEFMTLRVEAEKCTTRFDDMLVRVDPAFKLEVHIDTDEANACDLSHARRCELVRNA
ncbi:MAG: phosphate propanoyltransferase [Opitutaceae bacterium]|nr:phosphate propanoyltransferase [Opitutaceae bacterium]